MYDKLSITRYGPIKKAEIEIRPLTILVGPQGAGKSIISQYAFLFKSIRSLLARADKIAFSDKKWREKTISGLLNKLRYAGYKYYLNGPSTICYNSHGGDVLTQWEIVLRRSPKLPFLNDEFITDINQWFESWGKNLKIKQDDAIDMHFYLPTERQNFVIYRDRLPLALIHPNLPIWLYDFNWMMYQAGQKYKEIQEGWPSLTEDSLHVFHFCIEKQLEALGGRGIVQGNEELVWWWELVSKRKIKKIIPIESISSGQMQAWPIFTMVGIWGALIKNKTFFIEDPEAHLHPYPQKIVMEMVAHLINRGRPIFITTHSPYILYALNNMLQRYQTFKGKVPKNEGEFLDPNDVAAYLLKNGTAVDLLDREKTGLVDARELEGVAEALGEEFENLLYSSE